MATNCQKNHHEVLCREDAGSSTLNKARTFCGNKIPQTWPFPYGYHVAFCAIMMSIVTLFSVTVPLVAPAGALFFGAKLAADKYDILVLCPPDSEKEAGLSYANVVPVVTVMSLILFNAGMFAQFLLLQVSGPAAVAGTCLALCVVSCITWAVVTVRNKRRLNIMAACADSEVGQVQLDRNYAADKEKERALLVRGVEGGAGVIVGCVWLFTSLKRALKCMTYLQTSHMHPLLRNMATLPEFL
jgi:hypothetical protein